MSEPALEVHPEVLFDDLQEIANHISLDNPYAADRVLEEIDSSFLLLTKHPLLGTEYHPIRRILRGIRMFVVTAYPNYLIYYRPLPGDVGVRILYVLHAARDVRNFVHDHKRQ
jgi:plasmid stabilization system protein ParE